MEGIQSGGQPSPETPPEEAARLLLQAGHPVSLRLAGDDRVYRASVTGLKPGEFLIVKPTLPVFARVQARMDLPLQARLEKDGVLYGFEVHVLSALKHPGPFLFLAYPKEFAVRALRRHPRVPCLLPTVIEGDGFSIQGHLRDISLGGCRVSAPSGEVLDAGRLTEGDPVDIRLPLGGLSLEKLSGQVRLSQRDNGLVSLGVSFREDERTSEAVARFVKELAQVETLCRQTVRPPAPPGLPAIRSGLGEATACVRDSLQVELKALEPLDIQFTGNHLYEQSTILGVDGTQTVITEMPLSCGLKNCPKPGMGLKARFENHGSYYGFLTSVTRFVTKPRPLVFFTYPKKIEILARRKHTRIKCHLPVRLDNEHFKSNGYITDISQGGCRVLANLDDGECVLNVMTGDAMAVSLPLDGLDIETLRAKVKTFRMSGNAAALRLVFSLDKRQASRLGGFMDRMEALS